MVSALAVVDPLFTLALAVPLFLYLRRPDSQALRWGLLLGACYFGLSFVQPQRGEAAALALAQARGHQATQLSVKPSMANLVLWRSLYVHDGRVQVDAAVTSAPVAETMAMPATPPLEEKKKRPWWWWLLWLLLLLLLLLAVLAGMRACSPTPPAVTPPSLPPIPAPPPPPPPPAIEPPAPVPEPAVSAPPPPPPPKPKPAAPPKPPEPPKPPDTRGLQPQAGLKIPPNALKRGDLSFLEGLWQLGDQCRS